MVDVVGDVAGEAPVEAAVLEQVHDRHRGVGEPVDEDGLQQALGIVANPETKGGISQDTKLLLKGDFATYQAAQAICWVSPRGPAPSARSPYASHGRWVNQRYV